MDTPWKRAKKTGYQRQEEALAKKPGGKKQLNSGRHFPQRRDVRLYSYLIEARLVESTKAKSYTLKNAELEKLTKDAFFHNVLPGMQIDFQETGTSWILTRLGDWEALLQHTQALEFQVKELQEKLQVQRET